VGVGEGYKGGGLVKGWGWGLRVVRAWGVRGRKSVREEKLGGKSLGGIREIGGWRVIVFVM